MKRGWMRLVRPAGCLLALVGLLRAQTTVAEVSPGTAKEPNPPSEADPNIVITPVTRSFGTGGGAGAIATSGSGTWTASASGNWITLNATRGQVGYPVAYTVGATAQVEGRTGYVYVSGHTHTVTQEGLGATISPGNATYESEGGTGVISVAAPDRIAWHARANCGWLAVGKTGGTGAGTLTYTVAPYSEVNTRQGTLTVAGNTFTVFQYGRRMKVSPTSSSQDYLTHVIPITVDALSITEWDVEPLASWISVVDAGNGKGSDLVTIAIAENPSWKGRSGSVRIGTERFTVSQAGRRALEFSIDPTETTASVEGANGLIAVTATPDLPWNAVSQANWLTVYAQTASGAGNGNVAYSVAPNPTLDDRTGKIVVTPGDSLVPAAAHTVAQPAAASALSMNGYEFEAAGESCEVRVSVPDIVQWNIRNTNSWLTVIGSTNRVGAGMVVLQAAPNDTVYPKSGTVTVARKAFKVSQKARGVEVEYDTKLFGTDGGYESISIHPDGQVAWTAVASDPTWITIFGGGSGSGDGEIIYIVSPYVGDGEARTGTITVGDKVVYITQRPYELSIDPKGAVVGGNNGAGEFGVSAGTDDVWSAIVTEPWITLVENYDSRTGNGVVRFLYTANDTGKVRVGKIVVAGEVYTLEQRARQMVSITAEAGHGGSVEGAGSYDLGTEVELTAVPDGGYAFSYWMGSAESMENPLRVVADVPKGFTAVFEPLPIAFTSVVSDTNGVALAWNNLAWAVKFRLYRGTTGVPSSATLLKELPNTGDCSFFDDTGEAGTEYWYWVEAQGVEDDVTSEPMTGRKVPPAVFSPITYTGLKGAANPNPAEYQEGLALVFSAPGAVKGYTFAGWVPAALGVDATGPKTVKATWTANGYTIAYNPNGGSGTMEPTACTYGKAATVASNGFVWPGHRFAGWGTSPTSGVVHAEGQEVKNLASANGAVVTFYAVWNPLEVPAPAISPADGSTFVGESCVVSIACAMEDAAIYYTTDGTTPRVDGTFLYAGPFAITGTATVKAVAVLEGVKSAYAAATLTQRILTLAEAVGAPELDFATGGDAAWLPVADASAHGGSAAQGGPVGKNAETWMEATVSGAGLFRFQWKVDCEHDDSGDATWDHLAVSVDGAEFRRIDGSPAWAAVSVNLDAAATHSVRWTFSKDGFDAAGSDSADRAWVSGVVWIPTVEEDPIPAVSGDSEVSAALEGSADPRLFERLATASAYNEYRVWVAAKGLDRQAVKDSPHAWPSFALGADALFANEPTILLGTAGEGSGGTRAAGGGQALLVGVTVKDGEAPASVDAGKVAGLFEATGGLHDWGSEARLSVQATPAGSDGQVLFFRVVPGDGTAKKAFVRLAP